MPIRILDAATVGRIAAGEVVERPSSVVKELVENSLDAGATAITVEMRAGGIEMLRVTDNGCGIEPGQARLAFENHATSKLQTADQLDDIRTLGFRGEALPSIAAVSHVEMTTRARGQASGVKLNIDGGQNVRVAETGCPEGTTIVMRDLFYNIPVRRAFLKKPAYEAGLVSDAVARLMLGNPRISMRLVSNGNTVYHTFGDGKLRHAVFAVYGKETAEKMVEIDASLGATRVWGLIGVGELAKSTRAHQMFFINGRSVRCGLLTRALEQVCRSRVTIGLYPMCALNLTLPPNAIDVNVHPNKLEVRFRDEAGTQATVEKLLSSAFEGEHVLDWKRDSASVREITKTASVREVIPAEKPTQTNMFTQTPSIREIVSSGEKKPQTAIESAEPKKASEAFESDAPKKPQMPPLPGMGTHIAETQKANPEAPVPLPFVSSSRTLRECDPVRLKNENRLKIVENKLKSVNNALENEKNRLKPVDNVVNIPENRAESVENKSNLLENSVRSGNNVNADEIQSVENKPEYRVLGVAFKTYILIESGEALLLIDQHAAHERLMFEKFRKQMEAGEASQGLLTPIVIRVSAKEMSLIVENKQFLNEAGYEVEPFGETDVQIRAVPYIMGKAEVRPLFMETIGALSRLKTATRDARYAELAQMACKAAVKGGDPLSESEIDALIREMLSTGAPPTCPHGRPVVKMISRRDLEKMFKRIQ